MKSHIKLKSLAYTLLIRKLILTKYSRALYYNSISLRLATLAKTNFYINKDAYGSKFGSMSVQSLQIAKVRVYG